MMYELKPCPICGRKAFLHKDVADGAFYGYSVGCPRASVNDRIHKLGEKDFKEARIVMHLFGTKEEAVKAWNERCEK